MEQEGPVKREGRLTLVLALATLIAAFGSSFQYGYNVAVVNSPAEVMKAFYNETYYDRTTTYLSDFSLTLLWSISVSMFPFGGFIGSLMVGVLVNKLGRKGTLLLNNIFSIVPAILMGCSEVAKSFEMIILSRLLVGICAGLSSNVVPMYLGELAPKNLRGALGVVPQLFITVGILVAQIFGLRNLLANEEGWTILLGVTGIPAAAQLLLLPFFPESPRYLLIQKKDSASARKALQRLRGWEDVDREMEEIRQEDEAEKAAGFISVVKLFQMRSLRWQLISVIILMGGQQLSGVNAIYYYADQIYVSAGVNTHDVQYVTVGTGAINVVVTFLAVFVVELLGRRLLILLGFSICFTACCVLTAALALQDSVSWMPYLSIACVISYVIGHALGPSMYPELLPRLRCPPSCTIGSSSPERPGEAQLPLSPGSGQSVLRAKKWSHPRAVHHRGLPAVLPVVRLHGGGQRPLALQLHRGLGLPLHSSGPRALQLHHLRRDMSAHHHLHLPDCPRDQGQDIHGDQSYFCQDE
uniref:Solute carrier family 2, facilitated glucose transporter member 5 n=1 Tax=Rousettus aegyptiacus TaxID=9407 RepID=A0A7J8KGQ2_ROUAE|nr:solute carrier family 2 member 5 [Rousettus aegyptiacus]